MRGAAALAYLSLQHKNLRFDWMNEPIRRLTKVISFSTTIRSVLDGPKILCAFNDLRSVGHDKA